MSEADPHLLDLALKEIEAVSICHGNASNSTSSASAMMCNESSSTGAQYEYNENVKYITLVIYMATFVFGLCGNSLVIYIIWHFDKVRKI